MATFINRALTQLTRLLRGSTGSACIEYGLILALIALLAITGVASLSGTVDDSFVALSGGPRSAAPNVDAAAVATEGERAGDESIVEIASTDTPINWRALAPLLSAILISCIALPAKYYSRRMAAAEEAINAVGEPLPAKSSDVRLFAKRQRLLRTFLDNASSLVNGNLTVDKLTSTELVAVEPSATLDEMHTLMDDCHMRHLLVCKDERLLGIVSDRDLRSLTEATAAEAMVADPSTIAPDALVKQAITTMMKSKISALPVVKDDRLVGVFTLTDVAMAFQCALQLNDDARERREAELNEAMARL